MSAAARLGATVSAVGSLASERRLPFLDAEEIAAVRDARLREIVRYAADTVPYYRDLFRAERIDPREIESVDDLVRLPLIEKRMLQAHPERFLSTAPPGVDAVAFRTSGSTGIPIEVMHDRESLLANIGHAERERAVVRTVAGRRIRPLTLRIGQPNSTGALTRAFYGRATVLPGRRRRSVSIEESPARVADALDRFRPHVLTGFGTTIELLFRWASVHRPAMYRPAAIEYHADALTAEGLELIEQSFGIPVLSRYNSTESFKIGFACEERRGLHLHDDLCHVAIVDDQGKRLPPGERGEVVISNLVNRGTVLLNYRLGDRAVLGRGSCPCGRGLSVLDELEGRVDDVIVLDGGRYVHPVSASRAAGRIEGVIQFQLVQRERMRFELKLVVADAAAYAEIAPRAREALTEVLAPAIVETSQHERIATGPRGKLRRVVPLPPEERPDVG